MLQGLTNLLRRIPWSLWTILALLLLLWIVGRIIGPLLWLAALLALISLTYWVARPDVRALAGQGSARPWLVRIREHSWRTVRTPLGPTIPRGLAYAFLAIGWWWLLS